jgi:hypothetical protein
MSTTTKRVPQIGSVVRPVGSSIRYRVVDAHEHGCRVEAIDAEVQSVPGRKPRPLHYSEKRASLAVSRVDGSLFDDSWRAWEVVS